MILVNLVCASATSFTWLYGLPLLFLATTACEGNPECQWYENWKACNNGVVSSFCERAVKDSYIVDSKAAVSPPWSHNCYVRPQTSYPAGWEQCEPIFTVYEGVCVAFDDRRCSTCTAQICRMNP